MTEMGLSDIIACGPGLISKCMVLSKPKLLLVASMNQKMTHLSQLHKLVWKMIVNQNICIDFCKIHFLLNLCLFYDCI